MLLCCVVASGAAAQRVEATPPGPAPPEVLVVALPGLTWPDVAAMPTLRALMARGAVGSMTAKAADSGTLCLAGALSFSAGNRALRSGPSCTAPPPGPGWAALRSANLHSQYAADIGALGAALRAAGVGTVAASPAARPLLAGRDGTLAPAAGPSGRRVVAVLDTALYAVPTTAGPARQAAQRLADQRLHEALDQPPPGSTVVVTATADGATGQPTLHPLVIAGPGWPHRELRFTGSGPPYTELIDLAPTILQSLRIPVPSSMVGKPLRATDSAVQPIARYVDQNRHAVADGDVEPPFVLLLGWLTVVLVLLVAGSRPLARPLARLVAPAPALSYLVNLLPWWRWDRWVYGLVLAAGCGLVAVTTTWLARRHALAGLLLVPAGSFALVVLDQLAGARMQLSSPLGYSPLNAGRFTGLGNLGFGVLAAAAIVVASVAGAWLPRRLGLWIAGAILLLAVVVDAAPALGDDVGGVLALAPASVVVLVVLAGVRLSLRRIAGLLVGAGLLAAAIALADYSRPASSQTHVGQFVGQLLHGGAGTEVGRKAHSALATVGLTLSTAMVVVAIGAAVVGRQRLRAAAEADPGLLAMLAGGVTVAAIGSALNDSGLSIAAVILTVGLSAASSVQWPIRTPIRQDATSSPAAVTTTTSTSSGESPDSPGR